MVRKGWLLMCVLFLLIGSGCGNGDQNGKASEPVSGSGAANDQKVASQKPDLQAVTFKSKALKKKMALNVYLPPDYDQAQKYPVLYLLHGYTGNQNSWMPDLGTDRIADQLIENGSINPLIIVSVQYENSYGLNTSSKTKSTCQSCMAEGKYQDYLAQDVIAYIDGHYSTIAAREGRYIGGLSMGGFASLYTAFTHPDLFSKAGGHSPALWVDHWINVGNLNEWLYPNDQKRKQRDPIELAKVKDLSGMKVYLDCGRSDSYQFYEGAEALYKVLQDRGVASEYHLNDGQHDSDYWQSHVEDYLKFYAGK